MSKTKKYKRKNQQSRAPYLAVVKHDAFVDRRIGPTDVNRAVGLLSFAKSLDQRPIGPLGHCYENAYDAVKRWGGKVAIGWLVTRDGIARRMMSQNRLARACLYVHAVWQSPNGRLVEVTEGLRADRFVPDEHLGLCGGGHIEFPDDYRTARRVIAERMEEYELAARWSIVWIRKQIEQSIGGLCLSPGTTVHEYERVKTSIQKSVFWHELILAL